MARQRAYRILGTLVIGLTVLALAQQPLQGQTAEEVELLELNARLFQAQIVERDAELLGQVALPQFRVLAPGGLIENKQQAMDGVAAWDVTSIELSGEEVIREGPVAVVMGRLDIDGTMAPVGRFGPLKYMGVRPCRRRMAVPLPIVDAVPGHARAAGALLGHTA